MLGVTSTSVAVSEEENNKPSLCLSHLDPPSPPPPRPFGEGFSAPRDADPSVSRSSNDLFVHASL